MGQSLYIRGLGLAATLGYATLIGWMYIHQPQTMAEVTGAFAANVGVYHVDQVAFDEGLRLFRNDQFAAARLAFDRSDPARRDATAQFYVAYSFYREGWGRLYNDDRLFAQGLEAANRAGALATNGGLRVDDPNLAMRTVDELKAELESGMRRDASDFNPMRVFRQRK